jgi:hypothetical protein
MTDKASSIVCFFAVLLVPCFSMRAQNMVGLRAGIVEHIPGNAFLDDSDLLLWGECSVQMRNGQRLRPVPELFPMSAKSAAVDGHGFRR